MFKRSLCLAIVAVFATSCMSDLEPSSKTLLPIPVFIFPLSASNGSLTYLQHLSSLEHTKGNST